jgi:hypothetical protein
MKKYLSLVLLALFMLACSFTATPTSMPIPTSTPSTGWYGYESTEIINESYWTPKDAESPDLYKLESTEQIELGFVNPNEPPQFIEKGGKIFLDYGYDILYWPKDLNQNLINDALNMNHLNPDGSTQYAQMIVTIYYHNGYGTDDDGQFRVITKVFIKQFPK